MTFQVEFATQPKVLNVEFDTALNISGGYDDGYNDGFSQGKSEGLTEGEEIGYNKGSTEAMTKFVESRGLKYLYLNANPLLTEADFEYLKIANLDSVTDATEMFYGFLPPNPVRIPLFDTSKLTTITSMFKSTANSQGKYVLDIPDFDFSSAVTANAVFEYRSMVDFPNLKLNDSGKANFGAMFSYASFANDLYLNLTVKADNIASMFDSATVKEVVNFEAPNTYKTKRLFYFSNVTKVHRIVVGGTTGATSEQSYMFGNCQKLTEVGAIIGLGYDCRYLFQNCKSLETVADVDMRLVGYSTDMFKECKALKNLTLKNIKASLTVGSGTTYGHLLTVDSLVGLCYELRDTGATRTLTVGSANLKKLTNVYVREIPITDAMREADDLIDEKLPFERCESTADGATLITDYVLLKNWKLA